MECRNHPGREAADRCAGCAEAFCPDCLVEIQGRQYCGECKVMALREDAPPIPDKQKKPCKEANAALTYAIIGIFCFGILLGPLAISKALRARKLIEADPYLNGSGKATAGLWLGAIVTILWGLYVLGVIAGAGQSY